MSIWVLKSFHATNQTKELDWLSYLSNILSPTGQKVGGSKKIVPPLSKPWRRPCVCLSVQSHAGILSKRLRVLKLFHLGYITSHTILVFAHQTVWQYSASRGKHASHSHRLKNIGLITPYSIETKLRGGALSRSLNVGVSRARCPCCSPPAPSLFYNRRALPPGE